MIKFRLESFPEIKDEAMHLLVQHFEEISANQDIKLNPNFDHYGMLEDMGLYKFFTARIDGKLVGYCSFFLANNFHYQDSFQAQQDILFLTKMARGYGNASKLIKYCDQRLKELGVQVVYQHVKLKHDFSPLLVKHGYKRVEYICSKRLDHA